MTVDEANKAFDEMRAQGATDDEILATLYIMFQEDKLNINELEALCHVLGYEFTDEFKNMSPEDQKTKGFEETEETEASDEEVEDAKEVEPGEKPEEEESEDEDKDEDEDEGEDEKDESEEDEKKKAKKLFGFDE